MHAVEPTASEPNPARPTFSRLAVSWLRDLLIAVALALLIIAFVYQPVKVEGTSMAPHLADQERIFINKFVYNFGPIERGDIVVFRYPLDPRKSFIKRVVGLPGETLEIRRGTVYINGLPLREDYLRAEDRDRATFPPVSVPASQYFVLGDYRRSSNDSRSWGAVHRDYIYGKAVFAYWPPERIGLIESTNGNE
jgi:signal peptidase I